MKIRTAYLAILFLMLCSGTSLIAQEDSQEDSVDHSPRFIVGRHYSLPMQCVEINKPYLDSVLLGDPDLTSLEFAERVRLRVVSPANFSIIPAEVVGPLPKDTIVLRIQSPAVPSTPGQTKIILAACDDSGRCDTLRYLISISAPSIFSMPIVVSNTVVDMVYSNNARQTLIFGTGLTRMATTGYESSALGRVDTHFCEYELPPKPPFDVFDARWVIPATSGTIRNIHPANGSNSEPIVPWIGTINSGNPFGTGNLPIRLEWYKGDAWESGEKLRISDLAGVHYNVDMQTGQFVAGAGIKVTSTTDSVWISIYIPNVTDFKIERDFSNDVEMPGTLAGYRLECLPTPSTGPVDIIGALPAADHLRVEIFDGRGERVRLLEDGRIEAGERRIIWDGRNDDGERSPSGTYYCRMTTTQGTLSRTLILTR